MKNGKMSIRKIDGGYSIFAQLKCEVQFPKAENLNPELWNRGTTLIGCEIITSWNFKQGDKISVHVFPGMITSERIDMLEMYPQDFKNTHWAEAKKSYYSRVYYEGFYTEPDGREKHGSGFIVDYSEFTIINMPDKKQALEIASKEFLEVIAKYSI